MVSNPLLNDAECCLSYNQSFHKICPSESGGKVEGELVPFEVARERVTGTSQSARNLTWARLSAAKKKRLRGGGCADVQTRCGSLALSPKRRNLRHALTFPRRSTSRAGSCVTSRRNTILLPWTWSRPCELPGKLPSIENHPKTRDSPSRDFQIHYPAPLF